MLIGATLGTFFPAFGEGSTLIAIAVSLAGIWSFHFMILRGIKQATFINAVVTVAKIVPILVALIAMLIAFNWEQFSANFWGGPELATKPLLLQVRDTMLITVFVFIGIEGASVYSRFAKERSHVGSATILGFIGVTGLMVAVTMLPYALVPVSEVAGLRQPSLAGALELAVGPWGRWFISIGVLVSVLGAYLAWSLICAEILFASAKSKDMPKIFARENKNKVPANALWATNITSSAFVISTFWSADAFNFMLNMATVCSLLPYLLVAGYSVMVARSADFYRDEPSGQTRDLIFSWIAVVYVLFMFVAAGPKYVLLVTALLGPGTVFYIWARREQNLHYFSGWERIVLAVVLAGAVVGIVGLATGQISV